MYRYGYPGFPETGYPELPSNMKFHPYLQKHIFCLYRTNYVPFYREFANNYYIFYFMYNNYTSHVPCYSYVSSTYSSSTGASILLYGSQKCSKAVAPAAASTTCVKSYLPRFSTTAFADPSTFSRSSTFLYPRHFHAFLMIFLGILFYPLIVQAANS